MYFNIEILAVIDVALQEVTCDTVIKKVKKLENLNRRNLINHMNKYKEEELFTH